MKSLPTGSSAVHAIAFSPDGEILAAACGANVLLWNWKSGTFRDFKELGEEGWAVAFSSDGKLVAAGGLHGRVMAWNVKTGGVVAQWNASHQAIFTAAFAPGDTLLATGGDDAQIRLWAVNPEWRK